MIGYSAPSGAGMFGAGIGGLMQGIQQGQQMNNNAEKMEMLQEQNDRNTDNYENKEANERLYAIRQAIKDGGNPFELMQGYNKWAKTTKNFADEDDLSMGNWDNYRKDDGGMVNLNTINQYEGDTGREFKDSTTNKQPIMLGDKFFDFDSFAMGAPKFAAYAKERDLANTLTRAKIAGEVQGETKYDKTKSMKDKLRIEKIPEEKRTKEDKLKLSVSDQTLGMTKNEAVDDLVSSDMKGIFTSINKGDFSGANKVSPELVTRAEKAQIQGGEKYDKYDATSKELNTMNMIYNLSDKFKDLDPNTYDSGVVNKMVRNYATMADKKGWENISKTDREKMLKTVGLSSEVGMATAQILKDISGAAVSDEEFQRIMKVLTGGDVDLKNPQSVAAALRGAGNTMATRSKNAIQNIREIYSPADKLKLSQMYNQYWRPESKQEMKGPGKESASDAAAGVASSEAKAAANLKTSFVKEILSGNDEDDKEVVPLKSSEILNLDDNAFIDYLRFKMDGKAAQDFVTAEYFNLSPEKQALINAHQK